MNMMNFRPARMIPVQSGHGAPHMQLMRMGSMGVRPHFAPGGMPLPPAISSGGVLSNGMPPKRSVPMMGVRPHFDEGGSSGDSSGTDSAGSSGFGGSGPSGSVGNSGRDYNINAATNGIGPGTPFGSLTPDSYGSFGTGLWAPDGPFSVKDPNAPLPPLAPLNMRNVPVSDPTFSPPVQMQVPVFPHSPTLHDVMGSLPSPAGMGGLPYSGGLAARGGRIGNQRFAAGGVPMPAPRMPGEPIHTGALRSPVSGRTDHIPVTVPEGAYVIPADVVNYYGQDNSEAGHRIMEQIFHGEKIKAIRRVAGPNKNHVPIAAAGGEYIIPPESVMRLGGGDIKRGHAILDHFVLLARKNHINTLKKLPGPKKGSR